MLKKQRKEILILLFIAFFAGILWMGIESNTGENLVVNLYQLCFLEHYKIERRLETYDGVYCK